MRTRPSLKIIKTKVQYNYSAIFLAKSIKNLTKKLEHDKKTAKQILNLTLIH